MENNLSISLNGLNALICGSTSGIGKATAIEFSNLGANVTLFSRNKKKLVNTLKSLKNDNNQPHNNLDGDFNQMLIFLKNKFYAYKIVELPLGPCHGDLTFSNIIVS